MKSLIFLLIAFTTLLTFAQKPDKKVHLKHTIREEQQQIQFFVLDNDESQLSHYDKSKMYFWFKSQKILSTQGGASGQLLHGELEGFYANKQLSKKGHFHKGLKDGLWLYWNENGILIAQEFWRNGVKSGFEKHFDENGKLIESIRYKGAQIQRSTKDSIIYEWPSKNKKTVILLNEDGSYRSKISLKNKQLHGKQVSYEQGKALKTEVYKKGKLQSKKTLKERFAKTETQEKDKQKGKDSKVNDSKSGNAKKNTESGTKAKKTQDKKTGTDKKKKEGGLFQKKKKES